MLSPIQISSEIKKNISQQIKLQTDFFTVFVKIMNNSRNSFRGFTYSDRDKL